MGFVLDIEFPITDGPIVAALKSGLSSWSGLTVAQKRPATMTKRVVAVRNDSGPQEGVRSRRRYGVNVWADSAVDAENLALDAMREARQLAGADPIKATDSFNGPFEVDADVAFVFGGKPMTNYYFTFRATVKGATAP